jgi:hypothetical protein
VKTHEIEEFLSHLKVTLPEAQKHKILEKLDP